MRLRSTMAATVILTAATLAAGDAAASGTTCVKPGEAAAAALFERWSASLATLHPDRVLRNYTPDAVVLPLAAQSLRRGEGEVRDYYVYFLQREPRATIEKRDIRIGCGFIAESGIYVLAARTRAGKAETFQVRYSFTYENRDGDWLIVHEHASLGPDKGTPDKVALVGVDPLAGAPDRPKAVAGFVKRASGKRKAPSEPVRPSLLDSLLQWQPLFPPIEAR